MRSLAARAPTDRRRFDNAVPFREATANLAQRNGGERLPTRRL
jgi:hypothetical protein